MSDRAAPHSPQADQLLHFHFDGRSIAAKPGQSIAAALYAAGVRTFTRSFKYHRPRGLFCMSGDCPNCLMNVDDRPNVRTCIEPVRDGQLVTHQNAWPSLDFDMLRIFDNLEFLLPVGFYYKRFHKPGWLWPIFEHTVRQVAGLGQIDVGIEREVACSVEHIHSDVCVIGGGRAGLAAARAAKSAGANVVLIDREPALGGRLRYAHADFALPSELKPDKASGKGTVSVHLKTAAFGVYEGNLVAAVHGDSLLKIRARQVMICTGSRQQPMRFQNNDLPGIMLGDAVLRLAHLHGVRAGSRAAILTDCDDGFQLAGQLEAIGIEVACIVDRRPSLPTTNPAVIGSADVISALGRNRLTGVHIGSIGSDGSIIPGSETSVACDLLCLASHRVPSNELLLMASDTTSIQAAGGATLSFLPCTQARGVGAGAKRFVCLCEDVTEKDIEQAITEGFDHIETLKRYSTVNMGPCQGKMCGRTAAELCARLTGRDTQQVGLTTSRPPTLPVEMAVLAADQQHHPLRRTPLHHWHQQAGASWMDAGQWKRPEHYGDPAAEVTAIRNAVGIIDVSTLGKFEIIGPDAAELLERIYLNKWADLKPGRVRYGAICNEDGILFDDGIGVRLDNDRYYLTATTGNAESVFQWLEMWRDIWRLNGTVLNQTSGIAAMNLAGPHSRTLLQQLINIDLSPAAFPYMTFQEAEVANIPCRLFRIGFVGELGYEIHCPAGYASQLWESLCYVGGQFGLRSFGVEAQRILRLEKGHLIIGVDTDALSNPLDAGLEGLVRFDKPSFHGREPLIRLRSMPPRSHLVGFVPAEAEVMPEEGCQVVENGVPVGRVTSVRFSPTLGHVIGLAWVPAARSRPGERFMIRLHGRDVPVAAAALPFYDPAGARLKS
jgi:sarcosine oxidase subunit alpha